MSAVHKLVIYAFCAAICVVAKEVLAFLPNIELVTFLLIMYAMHFPLKGSVLIATLFCFLQTILYGVGMWTPMYFIVWNMLVILVYYLKKYLNNDHICAIFSGCFGLIFGFLFSLPYFLLSIQTGWVYFIKGIPFDIVHGLANYIIMLILFDRITKLFIQLKKATKFI